MNSFLSSIILQKYAFKTSETFLVLKVYQSLTLLNFSIVYGKTKLWELLKFPFKESVNGEYLPIKQPFFIAEKELIRRMPDLRGK